ncbi:flagellar assembly protein FliH [Ketobacter sp.]
MSSSKKPDVLNSDNTAKDKMSAWERWHLPNMEDDIPLKSNVYNSPAKKKPVGLISDPAPEEEEVIRPLTAEALEQIRQAAYEEGLQEGREAGKAEGYQAGYTSGEGDVKAAITRMSQICRVLLEPIPKQDEELERVLLHLVEQICKRVVHRELSIESSVVLQIVEAALETIQPGDQRMKIHLNAADAEMVESHMKAGGEWEPGWRIQAHPAVTPGGCIIETDNSMVDARAERRLASVIRQVYEQQQQALEERGQQHGHVDQLLDEIDCFVDDSAELLAEDSQYNNLQDHANDPHHPEDMTVLDERWNEEPSDDGSQSSL